MVAEVGKPFCTILGWPFSGDVLDNTLGIFSVRWSRIVPRRRMAQKMVAEVGKPFCAILGWHFLGDVLDFVRRTFEKNNIQYSTIEFKVIDIVYIASIPLYK
jgi:hypothetical protein